MGFGEASLQKDCDKAARILKAFIDKGKIPGEVIANAKGFAIFNGFRAAMYLAGSGGSGVVVARNADGTWSPPSAFSVRSGGFGLAYGIDVFDCVCVLNTPAAVEAYTKPELELGAGVQLAAGPVGGTANTKRAAEVKPVWTYTKSKGIYGGLTVDGTVIREKHDVNAAFYGAKVTAAQVLAGEVQAQDAEGKWPSGAKQLTEVLKLAEGREADKAVLHEVSAADAEE